MIPMSSECPQLWVPHPLFRHSAMVVDVSVQPRSSSTMNPVPALLKISQQFIQIQINILRCDMHVQTTVEIVTNITNVKLYINY